MASPSEHGRQRSPRRPPDPEELYRGVIARDRAMLGRAITLIESDHPGHRRQAQELLTRLLPHTGRAHRVGITGVPGVGKSTFIENLGSRLTGRGHRVAVLAIDPSSRVSGGSILGDKTRMPTLAADDNAFIRPSPSGGALGGVARKTRESMLVCEAAGFDVILVETVGVGQSETTVADMVDFFLVLMLAGAGDELQGIKRGILELADLIAINKADGDNRERAERARREYARALHLMRPAEGPWKPVVVTCSALTGAGLDAIWEHVQRHRHLLTAHGLFEERRRRQLLQWMWSMVDEAVLAAVREHPRVRALRPELERSVLCGKLTPTLAAERILHAFGLRL